LILRQIVARVQRLFGCKEYPALENYHLMYLHQQRYNKDNIMELKE